MNLETLVDKMKQLEYHQSLLLKMVQNSYEDFYKLVIEKSLNKNDVEEFMMKCEVMSNQLEEQKAEGFVYFHPLFKEFKSTLHPSLQAEEVILACIRQNLFVPLMSELKKYI